jgi:Zn finger protein HypA/HybF involved in hydrogenase expression
MSEVHRLAEHLRGNPCRECGNAVTSVKDSVICPSCRWEARVIAASCGSCTLVWFAAVEEEGVRLMCPFCRSMTGAEVEKG